MFVHLDGGWMSHPFPLSSFRIASPDQLLTVRGLGLKRVRWSPEQSDAPPAAVDSAAPALPIDPAAPPADAAAARRTDERRQLAEQRAALVLCERQFAEAARDCKTLSELVPARPQEAREQAEALTRALVGKMLVEHELCIRLLTDVAGDKAAMHALNVTIISLLMGRGFGLSEADMQDLGTGAMLHDIGKTLLPDRVRHREEHFSAAETRFYEEHVAHGVALARKMGLTSGAMLVLAQHHEHADASGFPRKITTDRMTVAARIVALVNRYDKLCNPQSPGRAMTPHEALALLFAQFKNHFDTAILGAFIKMMGVYPPGSTVQLTDDRFAMVVAVNSSRPLKPRVLAYESGAAPGDALTLNLEAVSGLGIRRSIRPQQLPAAALDFLSPRLRVAYFFEPARGAAVAA